MAVAYNSHTGLRGPRYIAECRFLDTQDASCDVMTDRGRFLQVQRLEISIPVYSSTPSSSYGFVCHNLSPRAQIFVSLSCHFHPHSSLLENKIFFTFLFFFFCSHHDTHSWCASWASRLIVLCFASP